MTRKIRFLHIPKTAGSTFDECLFLQYLWPYLLQRQFVFTGNFKADVKRIHSMSHAARGRIVICTGHAPLKTGCEEFDEMPTVTLLRDPVARVRSFCQHVSEGKSPQLHNPATDGPFDLDDFLSRKRVQLNNFQTRLLLGQEGYQLPTGDFGTHAERAMERLESRIACFGITEDFDRSLLLLSKALGWKAWPIYRSRNIGDPRARIQFEARHISCIEELNQADIALYALAREGFYRRLAKECPRVDEDLPRFRSSLATSERRFVIIDAARSIRRRLRISNSTHTHTG